MRIGVDLVHVPRVSSIFQRPERWIRFTKRVLCKEELEELREIVNSTDKVRYVAARWAQKEACIKALSASSEKYVYPQRKMIQTFHDKFGRPRIKLNQKEPYPSMDTSVSHDGEYAMAVVLVE